MFNDHSIEAVHAAEISTDVTSPMAAWDWADKDCHFVDIIGREIQASTPASRHHWGLKEAALLHALIRGGCVTEHTFYQAKVEGRAIDLMQEPWVAASAAWTHGSDYSETQAVADAARDAS